MLDLDETALIEFFGCTPEPESQEVQDFFAAPFFIKRVDGWELWFSVSAHFRDMRLTLLRDGCTARLLELIVPEVISVLVERDSYGERLRITSGTHGSTEITVDPGITIRSVDPWIRFQSA